MPKKMMLIAIASGLAATAARWWVKRTLARSLHAERKSDVQRWEDEGGLVPVSVGPAVAPAVDPRPPIA